MHNGAIINISMMKASLNFLLINFTFLKNDLQQMFEKTKICYDFVKKKLYVCRLALLFDTSLQLTLVEFKGANY